MAPWPISSMRLEITICFWLTIASGLFCLMLAVVTSPDILAHFQFDSVLSPAEFENVDLRKRMLAVLRGSNSRQNLFWFVVGLANISVGAFGLYSSRTAANRDWTSPVGEK
jgi:hypothetical protein